MRRQRWLAKSACVAALAIMITALAVVAASAQTAATATVEEQFAAYHEALGGAADRLRAATAQHPTPRPTELPLPLWPPATVADHFNRALDRVQQLRPLLEPILREEGVPADLAAIVLVESGGRPTALSPKGARGLWQLMPETARRYGLMVSTGQDERLDLARATRAAARYLRDLHGQFGDWKLALAAYNAGEQAVQRALMRSGSHDLQRLAVFLPSETRAYVPAVMTARPLFAPGQAFPGSALRTARTAHVLYASETQARDNW